MAKEKQKCEDAIAIIRSRRESHDRQYNSNGRSVEIPKG